MDDFTDLDALETMLTYVRDKIADLRFVQFPTPQQLQELETWRRVRRQLVWRILEIEMFGS